MNTFIFKNPYYTNTEFSKQQLKTLYADFCDLGYKKTYQDFFADLSEYCEPYLGEEDTLFSKAAKPYLSERLFQILETLTQPGLTSRIFALCTPERQCRMAVEIPSVRIQTAEVLPAILSRFPECASLLNSVPEELMGFAPPIYEESEYPIPSSYPKASEVYEIRIGYKKVSMMKHPGEEVEIEIPAKVSITIKDGPQLYEVLFYWDGSEANLIHTTSVRDTQPLVIITEMEILSVKEYSELSREALEIVSRGAKKGRSR